MHRARQRLVGGALWLLACTTAPPVWAFHAGNLFDKAPGSGGGGGLFYVGSPRERGWTCAACHTEAPQRLRVRFSTEPSSLLAELAYDPGATYHLSFEIENEAVGVGSPLSNYNGLAFTALDAAGGSDAAGLLGGFPAEEYYSRGANILASAGQMPNLTSFAFDWTAPNAGASASVDFFVAVVDGNGANSAPTVTLTDPFGDDVWTTELRLRQRTATSGVSAEPRGSGKARRPDTPSAPPWPWFAVPILGLIFWSMSRLRSRAAPGLGSPRHAQ